MRIVLPIDPSVLSTAQQKGMFHGRVFTNPSVVKSMRLVRVAMSPYVEKVRAALDQRSDEDGIALAVFFLFPFPKSGSKAEKAKRREGQPVLSARYGDLDNRNKAFQDAIVQSGAIPDDRNITDLTLKKCYTLKDPRIVLLIGIDRGLFSDYSLGYGEDHQEGVEL